MTKLFGFNTLAGAKRSATTVVDGDTTSGRFDSTYVATAIKVPSSAVFFEVAQPFVDGSASLTGTLWTRFDMYQPALPDTNGSYVTFLNSGANAYRLISNPGGLTGQQFQYWNSTSSAWVNWGSTFSAAVSTLHTMTIKLVVNSSFQIYLGGVLVASSATVPTSGATAVTNLRLSSWTSGSSAFFSQIMGADFDIRDAHLFSKLATGEGTYTTGTGAYTDINEAVLDDSTAISLAAAGDKHSFVKGAISVASGLQIGAMVVNARGRIGTGVTDGKMLVRSSGSDSASAGKSFGSSYEPRGHAYDNDPATGTRWTQSGFNAAEFGVQAA